LSRSTALLAAAVSTSVAAAALAAPVVPDGFSVQPVVGGLSAPVGMAFLPDGRLLVVEQRSARIRLVADSAVVAPDPVATLPRLQIAGPEQGLLGIAVDPGWPARPWLYLHACDATLGTIRISRYTATGDLDGTQGGGIAVDPATRLDLIRDIPDDADNHNGGTVRFGVDGMLYASLGEDADPCGAQDRTRLKGVILRLDVSRLEAGRTAPAPRALVIPPGNPFAADPDSNARLVWATGLRNPFRFAVDPVGGALWIGDVGQGVWEEIDRAPAGGANFGWPWREGPDDFASCPTGGPGTAPIHAYDRRFFTAAVVVAGPYRAPAGAALAWDASYDGNVFFNDYYAGFVRRLVNVSGPAWSIAEAVPGQPSADDWATGLPNVSDWSVGPDGSLWFCQQYDEVFGPESGRIGRIVAAEDTTSPPPVPGRPSFAPIVPSPARDRATFAFTLGEPARVTLVLHDVGGRRVRTLLARDPFGAGTHATPWDGRDDDGRAVRPGVYVARFEADGVVIERRVPFLR
jgi:glucose/arabinose dehydrogenase